MSSTRCPWNWTENSLVMTNEQAAQERRRELRFPYSASVTLSESPDRKDPLQGRVENISPRGALISLQEQLPTNTQVHISFHVPYQKPAVVNKGHVRWSAGDAGRHLTGIEMVEENQVRMSLGQIRDTVEALDLSCNPTSKKPGLEESTTDRLQHVFSFEVYWGMLLWTFKDLLHTHFSNLTCDLSMGSFYLDKIMDKLPREIGDTIEWRQYQEILNRVDAAVLNISNFSGLFRIMLADHPRHSQDSLPEFICLDEVLSERVQSFKRKLSAMLIPNNGEINYFGSRVPEIIGSYSSLSNGFDFLLLHSYQAFVYHGAKTLQIRLSTYQDCLIIDFINDGSQSLHQRFLEISPNSPFSISGLHPKDKRQVSWLIFTMHFFADHNARLLLINESGKNIVSLRIPKNLSSTPDPQSDTH